MQALELWGGPECTVNRVGDRFRDQFKASGHTERLDDLDRFASLGLSALRYPILWEHVSPVDPRTRDWGHADAAMARLRELRLPPILGLVHHGSGPHYTNLLADDFATGLADHARAVAERYPWVTDWTPVNEPVTTARFAALYGHWYPHYRDERTFWVALLNQIDATRLAMREIRRVTPDARLIQTEDLGRSYATEAMRDQASFDNARRWMGWDLLCGRVTRGHMLWDRLCGFGLESRLSAIVEGACPPDVIGVNHYLTSDRFLDHRLPRYPDHDPGDNGCMRYIDTEAIRALQPPPAGLRGAIEEAWDRYEIPIAVTEVHNGSTREEQMRWLQEAWDVATELRTTGIDVRAITSWALLGSSGWNTLLTGDGEYEPGAFDVRGGVPRETALARQLRGLSAGHPAHPVTQAPGWWRRPIRFHHHEQAPGDDADDDPQRAGAAIHEVRPILIAGAGGALGGALAAACRHRAITHVPMTRADLDLEDVGQIAAALDAHRPWAVISAAGGAGVDRSETEPDACRKANAQAVARLAEACAERGIATVSFSSDLVFDGESDRAYVEADATAPLSALGRSDVEAERSIAALGGTHLIIRTAAFFSPNEPRNFAARTIGALLHRGRFRAANDQIVTPTYVPDLCEAVLDLVIDGAEGIWHLSNQEALSWLDFARLIALRCGLDPNAIEGVPGAELGWIAPRPRRVALASDRGDLLPTLDHAVNRLADELRRRGVIRNAIAA